MKKIDLITGFLGSGKTTFIKEYVAYLLKKGEKICILENDFGAVNVDMMLLSELRSENLELEMVSGGCDIDCHKRRFKTKLIAMGMDDYTRIIIEPSGVFDVDELFDLLYEEPLSRWYEMGSVITIVDACLEKELSDNSKYMLASQVAVAGKVILSKVSDSCDIDGTIEYVKAALSSVKCDRNIDNIFVKKEWSSLTTDDFEEIEHSGYVKTSYEKRPVDITDAYDSVYVLDAKLSSKRIKEITDILFTEKSYGNVFRVKGFFYEEDKWYELNATTHDRKISQIPEGQDVFIVIGENLNEKNIQELIQ